MAKIIKGSECYQFGDYDHKGTCSFRRVIVESWGKKQGTVSYPDRDGRMSEVRVYVAQESADFVLVSECADPVAEAIRRAAVYAASRRARYESILTSRADDASEGYLNAIRAELAAIHEPRAHNCDA